MFSALIKKVKEEWVALRQPSVQYIRDMQQARARLMVLREKKPDWYCGYNHKKCIGSTCSAWRTGKVLTDDVEEHVWIIHPHCEVFDRVIPD